MSEAKAKVVKAIRVKLEALVECVLARACKDSEFAAELQTILAAGLPEKSMEGAGLKAGEAVFDPVTYLHEHGVEGRRAELELKTDRELKEVIRAQGILKGAELRTTPRATLLAEIVAAAERRLKQGNAFL